MVAKPETLLKNRVKEKLEGVPHCCIIKIQQIAIRGDPDLVLCVNGWSVWVELKRTRKEKPDALQHFKLWRHQEIGLGYSLVLHKDNMNETIEFITRISQSEIKLEVPECLRLPKPN